MNTDIKELTDQAALQRNEAKRLLNDALCTTHLYASEAADCIVDCIISAALLESTAVFLKSMQDE